MQNNTISWNGIAGEYITAWEAAVLKNWVAYAFGFYAAQLGHTTRIAALTDNRCSERWAVEVGETRYLGQDNTAVQRVEVGDFAILPFASDSMDVIILPHTLDDHPDPHAVLREAYRVLRPEGQMFILGFNPMSIWGAQAALARLRGKKWWAYRHQAVHVRRIKDWLQLLNCDVVQGKYGCYAPCINSNRWLNRCRWLEDAGDRWWGVAGAVYALGAVKRVYSPTLVGLINETKTAPRWVAQPAMNTGLHHNNPPTLKDTHDD